ncbi:melanoma antigen preferentially expressed in tumors-like [Sorex araneus]|uniref:melanoma antigen preferentially expressed in tumors-like n=1 Tax=Sorex araneus TaxID=42254 RepID=UPI0024334288|nr:melanoma antigen preferentially expressed in tumors-like [Sorex araneus]
MDIKAVDTLLDLSIKSLLSNESAAIQALGELPIDLFVPLFTAAFLGRQKEVLKAMVRVWPFRCLHIGALHPQESNYDIMEAMVDGLQLLPAQASSSRGPKLRILDLRQDPEYRITCSYRAKYPVCFLSCIYSQHSILNVEEAGLNARFRGKVTTDSRSQSAWEPVELLVDLSFNSVLRTKQFISFLKTKIEQNFGLLHLCCRNLQIDNLSVHKSSLQIVNMVCTDSLKLERAHLRDVTTLLSQSNHLQNLILSDIKFRSCKGKNFKIFLTCLGKLYNLEELSLSFFCLTNQLHKLLRVLKPQLNMLILTFCGLSNRDIIALSQSTQATSVKLLKLSNNQLIWGFHEPLINLLERVSGTLQYLEINNCQITDSSLFAILPALCQCSHLRIFSFACNSITVPLLMTLVQNITTLTELKYVSYPVPLDCYEQRDFNGNLDEEKLAEVQAQLKLMLQVAQREDMKWFAFPV